MKFRNHMQLKIPHDQEGREEKKFVPQITD